jgi:hypothetical protein
MRTAVLAKILYGVFGALYLTAGATVLLFRTGLLPETVKNIILDVARDDLNAVHLSQEFGTFLIFVGLITFWFMRHYEQSLLFHWAMTATWGLFAFVHWYDVRHELESAVGPMINTIPFLLFLSIGLLTTNRKPGRSGDEKKVAAP